MLVSCLPRGSFSPSFIMTAGELLKRLRASVQRRKSKRVETQAGSEVTDPLQLLITIAERFPRQYDQNHKKLLQQLREYQSNRDVRADEFSRIWSELSLNVISTPQWLGLLLPEQCSRAPQMVDAARKAGSQKYLPDERRSESEKKTDRSRNQDGFTGTSDLMLQLLHDLATGDPLRPPPFLFLSKFYFFRDLCYGYFVDPRIREVQQALFAQCYLQRLNWKASYAADYPYQGMAGLGICGVKPTEERLSRYDIGDWLRPTDQVLDIGANNGFLALAVARLVAHVDAIEYNPYLVAMANIAADFLQAKNTSFLVGDFVEFKETKHYDAVFSLANHCTIDGNLSMDFEEYVAKCFSLLKPGGYLFFESHNVFGPGKGGPGDDGDLDAKFDIVERYFQVVRTRMTRAYVPAYDIDKLFVVLRRRETYQGNALRSFKLANAKLRYD